MENGESNKLEWVTLFDKMNKGGNKDGATVDLNDLGGGDAAAHAGKAKSGGGKKRLSVERIYQKKTQLEHILLRPDTYIGSVEPVTQPMWVWDEISEHMVQRDITFVPGLYKIFDEILVNAADNKQRDPAGMNTIKIDLDAENNKIRVWNNGKGIPVVEHQTEKMYVPTLIFGHLLTSSNYDDTEKKVTGGRNGYGAKLCNIFSSKFIVETSSKEYKKAFKQTWTDNMSKATEPKIIPGKEDDYTSITFSPDLAKFKMDRLDNDIMALFTRRAYDMLATTKGIKVFLNGKRLPIKGFKDYVDLYIKDKVDDTNTPLKLVHEQVNERWEVGVALSDKGFQSVSFVNCIATTKGGRHVDYVTDQIVNKLIEVVKKKEGKKGIQIKPFQVKNHIWVFVNCLIENPTFDSQTKENMTKQAKSFGSKCSFSDKFITAASKCGIVESIQSWMRFKQQTQLNKKMSGAKTSKLKGIPKLDDANDAGTRNSMECTLILTEGDSAKTLAVAGLGVVGRDRYGVFPLRGKLLNVREASHKQIMENSEVNNMIKILGLKYKEKYDTPETLKMLRYGKMMIMTDQDQDGSHIKGLLVNFIHHNWPNLLKHNFVEEFITPIVKVTKRKEEKCFYSLPEFEEWKTGTSDWHTWKVKYYKGLGTSTSKEAKEYFQDMRRHRIPFKYTGAEDDASIVLAFSKKKIEERKEWLTNWMEERTRRSQLGLPELYLYGKNTRQITYNEFVNRELILFSNMDNERSIPSLVDGLKPGQRKVLFTCFKRNLVKELKVAQLAGSVAELSAYHHGEQSLMGTIITLAQNFVGSNNINLLQPIGQFGTRLHGGKDAASPRYIFTCLSTLARHLFNVNDDPLLKALYDDNLRIEPEWYSPIIPTVLVNGAEGIGTGWSTRIHNYDVREICANIHRLMDDEEPRLMLPRFKNFKGTIDALEDNRYVVYGEVAILDDNRIEISELPIRTWTQSYKENVLEPMLQGTDKTPAYITDYKEYHTDTTVKFVVTMSSEKLRQAEAQGLHKVFKLQTTLSTASMVLFDAAGCIRRYDNVDQILREFYTMRLDLYKRRKAYLEGMLAAESCKMDNIARFICEKIDGVVVIENKPKKELIQMLVRRGYDSDPVKSWKIAQDKLEALEDLGDTEEQEEASQGGPDYNYLLSMPLWNLTKEKKEELVRNRDAKAEELYQLKKKMPKDLWRDDLRLFLEELEKLEKKEREDDRGQVKQPMKAGAKGRVTKVNKEIETKPSPHGMRVAPRVDDALKAKVATAVARKRKLAEKKELNFDAELNDDSQEPKSLAERIGSVKTESKPDVKPVKPKKPREKKPSGSPRGSPKKRKKGNPWSDEEEEIEDFSGSDEDLDNSFDPDVVQRAHVPRRNAAAKVQYKFDDEEDNKSEGFSSDSDFGVAGKSVQPSKEERDNAVFGSSGALDEMEEEASTQNTVEPVAVINSDDDDDDSYPAPPSNPPPPLTLAQKKEPPKKKPPAKKAEAAPKKKKALTVDSKQPTLLSALSKSSARPSNTAMKKPAGASTAKRAAAILDTDSEDGDDDIWPAAAAPSEPAEKPAKKATVAKRKPKTFDSDSDDLSDDEVVSKPKKQRVTKKPAPKKKAKAAFDSDVSEDEFNIAPAKSKSKKKTVTSDEDYDLEDEDIPSRAPARGGGRARKTVKYNFDEEDNDDDDDLF